MSRLIFPSCILVLVFASVLVSGTLTPNDQDALRFSLHMKRAQQGILSAGLEEITLQDFINAGYNVTIYEYIVIIDKQLQEQAGNISALLTSDLGACTYDNSTLTSPETLLIESRKLCNIVLSGMSGLLNKVNDASALALLGSGHAVSGRHCAYLNLVSGVHPFEAAHDPLVEPADTQTALDAYVLSCPYSLALPGPRRDATTSSAAALISSSILLLLLPFFLAL